MRQSKRLLLLALVAIMTMSFALAGTANAKMVKKIDNFIIFLDQSGSMAMTHATLGKKKIDLALETIQAMNTAIPDLDYNSAMFMFAPFQTESQPMPYSDAAIAGAAAKVGTDYAIFNRTTPMGNGLMDLDPVIAGLSGKTALIMFTDGNSNTGADPIAQAKALYAKYGDKLCIHVVSYADTARGQMIIDEIRTLSSCTVVSDAASLMAPGAMDQYAKDVFYEDAAAPAPLPVVVAVPVIKETITFSLQFGFDKYQITDEMIPVLEQAKMILEEGNADFEVAGHTDSTGAEAYNQGLSVRRADSVTNWMVANGVPASRLTAKGYGEMAPKYDNTTKEGRKLNRRVEILTK